MKYTLDSCTGRKLTLRRRLEDVQGFLRTLNLVKCEDLYLKLVISGKKNNLSKCLENPR